MHPIIIKKSVQCEKAVQHIDLHGEAEQAEASPGTSRGCVDFRDSSGLSRFIVAPLFSITTLTALTFMFL